MDFVDNRSPGLLAVISGSEDLFFDAYLLARRDGAVHYFSLAGSLLASRGIVRKRPFSSEEHVNHTYRLAREYAFDVARALPVGSRADQVALTVNDYIGACSPRFPDMRAAKKIVDDSSLPYRSPHEFRAYQAGRVLSSNFLLYRANALSKEAYLHDFVDEVLDWPLSGDAFEQTVRQATGYSLHGLARFVNEAQRAAEVYEYGRLDSLAGQLKFMFSRVLDHSDYRCLTAVDEWDIVGARIRNELGSSSE